VKLLADISTRL